MFCDHRSRFGVLVLVCLLFGLFAEVEKAIACKVLVIMSYEETYPWVQEIKEGIDAVLTPTCEITYFYMDTKKDLERGPQKAQEAYELYQEIQPDGVIAADDNAQSMFVVPYLKDKVPTPVMFCGVNAEPDAYGYPTSNVSGILERLHIRESMAFLKQLVPSIKTFGVIMKDSPSGTIVEKQIQGELDTYSATFFAMKLPKTLEEAITMTEELKEQSDALFIETLLGITDQKGTSFTDEEAIPLVVKAFGKPTTCNNMYHVKSGILCAVIKMGQEQGEVAAKMLLQVIQGTPVPEIPITRNKKGKRILNVTVMKSFGIKPKPHVLQGVEFVETAE